jgi:hypothetical protein
VSVITAMPGWISPDRISVLTSSVATRAAELVQYSVDRPLCFQILKKDLGKDVDVKKLVVVR